MCSFTGSGSGSARRGALQLPWRQRHAHRSTQDRRQHPHVTKALWWGDDSALAGNPWEQNGGLLVTFPEPQLSRFLCDLGITLEQQAGVIKKTTPPASESTQHPGPTSLGHSLALYEPGERPLMHKEPRLPAQGAHFPTPQAPRSSLQNSSL